MTDTAVYVRKSTDDQEVEHQYEGIRRWLDDRDMELGDVETYQEPGGASGASASREKFQQLLDDIQAGAYERVVVWEISRISRKGKLAQEFFDACEDAGTTIHVTNGSIREVEPDGTGRMLADVIAAVAAEERRALQRRTRAGIERAKAQGTWTGQVPVGFVRVDGVLRPNLQPDYDDEEAGFHDVVDALEAIDEGESYRKAAAETPNVSRQTLMRIDKDDDRRAWYLDGEADDERISEALEEVGK